MSDGTPESMIELIMSRLPPGDAVTVPDVSAAMFGTRSDTIDGWIREGELDALDRGRGAKTNWIIYKPSLEQFLRRRNLGIRAPASKRQLELFQNERK